MKTDDIDKIIAEALEAEKRKKGGTAKSSDSRGTNVDKVRRVLNVLFMIGFVAAVIVYFACPEQRVLFFSLGFGAMFLKIVEFALRFMF